MPRRGRTRTRRALPLETPGWATSRKNGSDLAMNRRSPKLGAQLDLERVQQLRLADHHDLGGGLGQPRARGRRRHAPPAWRGGRTRARTRSARRRTARRRRRRCSAGRACGRPRSPRARAAPASARAAATRRSGIGDQRALVADQRRGHAELQRRRAATSASMRPVAMIGTIAGRGGRLHGLDQARAQLERLGQDRAVEVHRDGAHGAGVERGRAGVTVVVRTGRRRC